MYLFNNTDTGTVLEENANDVATVENQGCMRGQAGVSITSSSQGREGQFTGAGAPMACKGPGKARQGLQVTNVNTENDEGHEGSCMCPTFPLTSLTHSNFTRSLLW
jgi:hypothetical protein